MKKLLCLLAVVFTVAVTTSSIAATPDQANSATVKVTEANYNEFTAQSGLLIVDFWAPWCGPCRAIAPILEELAVEYKGRVVVGKCNVDENHTLTSQFGVRSIPAIFFIKNGKVVDVQIGYCEKELLKEKIKKHVK